MDRTITKFRTHTLIIDILQVVDDDDDEIAYFTVRWKTRASFVYRTKNMFVVDFKRILQFETTAIVHDFNVIFDHWPRDVKFIAGIGQMFEYYVIVNFTMRISTPDIMLA